MGASCAQKPSRGGCLWGSFQRDPDVPLSAQITPTPQPSAPQACAPRTQASTHVEAAPQLRCVKGAGNWVESPHTQRHTLPSQRRVHLSDTSRYTSHTLHRQTHFPDIHTHTHPSQTHTAHTHTLYRHTAHRHTHFRHIHLTHTHTLQTYTAHTHTNTSQTHTHMHTRMHTHTHTSETSLTDRHRPRLQQRGACLQFHRFGGSTQACGNPHLFAHSRIFLKHLLCSRHCSSHWRDSRRFHSRRGEDSETNE